MRFGKWNIKSMYSVSSLMTVSRELSRYRLDFVGSAGGQMGGQWHRTCRGVHVFLWKGE
jgi:hypothetical protein